ncbi:MAG: DNA/RNA non-specific endonuclease [Flavobacteriales bacterium]|nr:DNA/RNA non-specific endonuclease [Flavobacteriales bacterium]
MFSQSLKELEEQLIELKSEQKEVENKIELARLTLLSEDLKSVGYPKWNQEVEVVEHNAMVLGYSEKHEQAAWVAHIILPQIEFGNVSRTNDFREDSLVSTGTAVKEDYWYSGYDRGHLAPSADFRWSATALSESYFYSNMAPQLPELNREKWAELENLIRDYVVRNQEQLYVVTGGVLKDGLPTMKNEGRLNEVSIPELFYKVVLDNSGEEKRGIAFLLPNGKCNEAMLIYAVSIDSVESLTGLNFFPDIEVNEIEAGSDVEPWRTEEMTGEVLPMNPATLPKGKINSTAAKFNMNEKACVCGTVVSTKYSEKSSATFLNLDKKFPNQVFSVTIWGDARKNFSYLPEEYLVDKRICVSGLIEDSKGTPSINVINEKSIEILD